MKNGENNSFMKFSSLFEYFNRLFSFSMSEEAAKNTAQRIADEYETADAILSSSVEELMRSCYLTRNAALLIKLVASAESRRGTEQIQLGRVYDIDTVYDYVKSLFVGSERETVYLLSFDKAGAVTGCDYICEGTVSASDIIPRMLLTTAVKRNAHSVLVAHNHPRGSSKPSKEDIVSTERLKETFAISGVELVGHVVVSGIEHTYIQT